jgi:hypothetical protein
MLLIGVIGVGVGWGVLVGTGRGVGVAGSSDCTAGMYVSEGSAAGAWLTGSRVGVAVAAVGATVAWLTAEPVVSLLEAGTQPASKRSKTMGRRSFLLIRQL